MKAWRIRTGVVLIALWTAPTARAVVGGQVAAPGQFPYVADVAIAGTGRGCSGVLVAPGWVMTAGHCTSLTGLASEGLVPSGAALPASAFTVILGTPNASGAGGETHSVSQVVVDPDYAVGNGVGNDVALLKLGTPSRLTPMLVAPDAPALWSAGVPGTIAGFGTLSEKDSAPPAQMHWATVPYLSDGYCASRYPAGYQTVSNDGYFDAADMVCAGYAQGGVDTCEGDSGGPLLSALPDGRLILVALTSFGDGCAEAGHPGVYDLLAAGPIRRFIASALPGALAPASVLAVPRRFRTCHRLRSSSGLPRCAQSSRGPRKRSGASRKARVRRTRSVSS